MVAQRRKIGIGVAGENAVVQALHVLTEKKEDVLDTLVPSRPGWKPRELCL